MVIRFLRFAAREAGPMSWKWKPITLRDRKATWEIDRVTERLHFAFPSVLARPLATPNNSIFFLKKKLLFLIIRLNAKMVVSGHYDISVRFIHTSSSLIPYILWESYQLHKHLHMISTSDMQIGRAQSYKAELVTPPSAFPPLEVLSPAPDVSGSRLIPHLTPPLPSPFPDPPHRHRGHCRPWGHWPSVASSLFNITVLC